MLLRKDLKNKANSPDNPPTLASASITVLLVLIIVTSLGSINKTNYKYGSISPEGYPMDTSSKLVW